MLIACKMINRSFEANEESFQIEMSHQFYHK